MNMQTDFTGKNILPEMRRDDMKVLSGVNSLLTFLIVSNLNGLGAVQRIHHLSGKKIRFLLAFPADCVLLSFFVFTLGCLIVSRLGSWEGSSLPL